MNKANEECALEFEGIFQYLYIFFEGIYQDIFFMISFYVRARPSRR